MASPNWRSRLVEALHRQGLPSAYINRLVEELSDHAADLFLESQSMDARQNVDARLGTPEQLAAVAKIEFQRRTFAGRHPVLTFVAAPIVAVIGAFLASLLLVIAACWMIDAATGGSLRANDETQAPPSPFEVGVMQAANLVVRFIPFALSAWLFVCLGRRSGVRAWSIIACAMIAVAALCFWSAVTPGSPQIKGTWTMGIGWRGWKPALDQILQAAVPAVFAVWMLRRSSMNRPKMINA